MARSTTTDADLRRDYWNATLAWVNAKGDWRDSTGAAQGTSAHAGCAVAVADDDIIKTTVFDLTALASAEGWFANTDRTCAVVLVPTGGNHHYATKEHATVGYRPSLLYSYADATSDTFAPTADAVLSASSAGSLGAFTTAEIIDGTDNFCLLFPPPVKALSSVTLTLTTVAQFSGGQTLKAFQVVVPGEAPPPAVAPNDPTDIDASGVTDTAMTIAVQLAADGQAPASANLYNRIPPATGWNLVATLPAGLGDLVSFPVTGLTPATPFEWQAEAENAAGPSGRTATLLQGTANYTTGGGGVLSDGVVITAPSSFTVSENSTTVASLTAITVPSGGAISWSLAGGADAARFALSSGGALAFVTPPNFEAPTDVGGNNVYNLTVRADSTSAFATQTLTVTVTNALESIAMDVAPVGNVGDTLTVTVTDERNIAIPGAVLSWVGASGGSISGMTDSSGQATVTLGVQGAHTLRASFSGFTVDATIQTIVVVQSIAVISATTVAQPVRSTFTVLALATAGGSAPAAGVELTLTSSIAGVVNYTETATTNGSGIASFSCDIPGTTAPGSTCALTVARALDNVSATPIGVSVVASPYGDIFFRGEWWPRDHPANA